MGPVEIKGIILALGVIAGLGCCWIGYRLYFHGVIEKGRMSVTAPGTVKITFTDYGPGVAFAALGAVIIIFCITRTLSADVKRTATYETPSKGAAVELGEGGAAAPPSRIVIEEQSAFAGAWTGPETAPDAEASPPSASAVSANQPQ